MSVPVVMFESPLGGRAAPEWLLQTIDQAAQRAERFYLLGQADVLHVLQPHYVHLSTNHHAFELVCLERWFVVRDLMEREGLDVVLHLDTDVLLYADPTEEYEKHWQRYAFTLALGTSPATSYITRAALQGFCDFVLDAYRDNAGQRLDYARYIFDEMQSQDLAGGISDMFFWREYARLFPNDVGEMTDVKDGTTWDHNLNAGDGYMATSAGKIIYVRDDVPYGTLCEPVVDHPQPAFQPREVRFNALHFQGGAKQYINRYARVRR